MGCGAAEATGLGFVCFIVINPRVLSVNMETTKMPDNAKILMGGPPSSRLFFLFSRVDFGLCFFSYIYQLYPPPPTPAGHGADHFVLPLPPIASGSVPNLPINDPAFQEEGATKQEWGSVLVKWVLNEQRAKGEGMWWIVKCGFTVGLSVVPVGVLGVVPIPLMHEMWLEG